jgi:hypothetical protein
MLKEGCSKASIKGCMWVSDFIAKVEEGGKNFYHLSPHIRRLNAQSSHAVPAPHPAAPYNLGHTRQTSPHGFAPCPITFAASSLPVPQLWGASLSCPKSSCQSRRVYLLHISHSLKKLFEELQTDFCIYLLLQHSYASCSRCCMRASMPLMRRSSFSFSRCCAVK